MSQTNNRLRFRSADDDDDDDNDNDNDDIDDGKAAISSPSSLVVVLSSDFDTDTDGASPQLSLANKVTTIESNIVESKKDVGDGTGITGDDSAVGNIGGTVSPTKNTFSSSDHEQRMILVEEMLRILFLALEKTTKTNRNHSTHRQQLVEMIQKKESGSTTVVATTRSDIVVSSISPSGATNTRTVWNKQKPLDIHWTWQTTTQENSKGEPVRHFTCTLVVLSPEGLVVEFFPPTSLAGALLSAEEEEEKKEDSETKIAVCEISNFEWKLKGSTKHLYAFEVNDDESRHHRRTKDCGVRSLWTFERIAFSMITGSLDDLISTEEVLLECRDVSLCGTIIDVTSQTNEHDNIDNDNSSVGLFTTGMPSLQLRSKSVLSLNMSSSGIFEGSIEERRRVGLLLRALVDSLDQLVTISSLQLSVGMNRYSETSSGHHFSPSAKEISFQETGLGDIVKYILQHYCNGSNDEYATLQPSQLLAIVSAAKDGVAAAARRAMLRAKDSEKRENQQRYQFQDVTRGLVGSILKKHE